MNATIEVSSFLCLHRVRLRHLINGISLNNVSPTTAKWTGSTVDMLNAMQQLMTGHRKYFDPIFLNLLKGCWDNADPYLHNASDSAWKGFQDYCDHDGFGKDPWGSDRHPFHEYNPTIQHFHKMVIYEPCNYASNVAYYHDVTEMCRHQNKLSMSRESYVAIIQSFTFLAFGSSVMHGSNTRLGKLDEHMIGVLSYAVYQASIENLRAIGASPIITDLSLSRRELTGVEIASKMSDMFLELPVFNWETNFTTIDMPDYEVTFAAIIASSMSLSFDNHQLSNILLQVRAPVMKLDSIITFIKYGTVDSLTNVLMHLFVLKEGLQDFILYQYIPEVSFKT